MDIDQDPTPKSVSFSLATLALGVILTLCVSLLGASGFIKRQIDRAEATLAAPDSAFTTDQDATDKTVIALGYSGFLGSAQNFMNTRDRAALGDMRMNFKTAQEAVARLTDAASAASRREVKAIMDIYSGLISKAEEGGDAMSAGVTSADLLMAASALSSLNAQLQSAAAISRTNAAAAAKSWGLAMMMIAWGAVIALGAMASVFYLTTRRRQSVPLRSLAQSVENMVNGAMQFPVWGTERRDEIGGLARAIDNARKIFVEIPDLALHTDDGMVRFKFAGESRAAFQSMMKKMSEHFEGVERDTNNLTVRMKDQHSLLTSTASHMGSVLDLMREQGDLNEESVRNLCLSLTQSAQALSVSQENNVAQVSRLVPQMQERIQNMAEVTHLAGSQIAQTLQSFVKSEHVIRDSATQSQQAVKQLAEATNQMGERMFAALNLTQASGKLLSETIGSVKSRFNEALDTLGRGETHLQQIIARAETRLASTVNAEENMAALAARTEISAEKMERAVNSIADRHEGLSEQVVTATHRMEAIVASFDAAGRAMSDATAQIRRDGGQINSLLAELRANNDQLLSSVNQNSQNSFSAIQGLAEKSHALMQRLEIQIEQQAQAADSRIGEIASHGQMITQQVTSTASSLSQAIVALKGEQEKMATTRGRFSEMISDLSSRFEQQATSTFGKTEQWAAQSFTKITTIAEQVDSVMQRLTMLGQLTGTLGTVAGQLGQLVPTLTTMQSGARAASGEQAPAFDMSEAKEMIAQQAQEVLHELQGQWHEAVLQIEAMHDQLAQLVIQQKDQLETRLIVMDKKLRDTSESETPNENQTELQANILNEVISAISKINAHVMEIDDVIEDAGLAKKETA